MANDVLEFLINMLKMLAHSYTYCLSPGLLVAHKKCTSLCLLFFLLDCSCDYLWPCLSGRAPSCQVISGLHPGCYWLFCVLMAVQIYKHCWVGRGEGPCLNNPLNRQKQQIPGPVLHCCFWYLAAVESTILYVDTEEHTTYFYTLQCYTSYSSFIIVLRVVITFSPKNAKGSLCSTW